MFPHFGSWRPWLITPARVRLSVNNGGPAPHHHTARDCHHLRFIPLGIILKVDDGGEGGIRTLETFRFTRFPSVRTKPGYATSPRVFSKTFIRKILFIAHGR